MNPVLPLGVHQFPRGARPSPPHKIFATPSFHPRALYAPPPRRRVVTDAECCFAIWCCFSVAGALLVFASWLEGRRVGWGVVLRPRMSTNLTTGRRIPDPGDSWAAGTGPQPGDYWSAADGWHAVTPTGLWCALRNHAVTTHDDGTITVSPSILVSNGEGGEVWHGFLERGVWRSC